MSDDAELLGRYAKNRSESAFAELVGRHVDLVYSASLRRCRGDHHRAQEVTQMVFTDLARKAEALARHPVLPAWLHRSSHLAALDLLRKEGRRHKYERAASAEAAATAPGQEAVAWDEVGPVLDEALDGLGERDRQAILLRYFGNRPYSEVGRCLSLSENAARMRVERALEKLHSVLARRGISSSSAALAAALTGNAVVAAPAGVAVTSASVAASVAASAGFGWIALMSTSKLPLALSAAVFIGGAGILAVQDQAAKKSAAEFADLRTQNESIPDIEIQNKRLSLASSRAHDLQDANAEVDILQRQVDELESQASESRALAAARKRADWVANSTKSNTDPAALKPPTTPPKLLNMTRPEYPADMQGSGTSGEVMVDLIVDKNGVVQNAFALSSTNKEFEAAAVNAVSKWTFEAGQVNDHTVFTHMQIPIVFTPSADAPEPTPSTLF